MLSVIVRSSFLLRIWDLKTQLETLRGLLSPIWTGGCLSPRVWLQVGSPCHHFLHGCSLLPAITLRLWPHLFSSLSPLWRGYSLSPLYFPILAQQSPNLSHEALALSTPMPEVHSVPQLCTCRSPCLSPCLFTRGWQRKQSPLSQEKG